MAGFITGTITRQKRCQAVAPSTFAARRSSSGTSERPAKRSSAMNGVVFQTSARMMMAIACHWCVSGAAVEDRSPARYPVPGVQAYCQLKAAATVTMP